MGGSRLSMAKTRDYVLLYINGKRVEVRGAESFLMLSDFLRVRKRLTGTKIVCAEGDCGACTVMRSAPLPGVGSPAPFLPMNACIAPVALLDCSHLVTVEGLREDGALDAVQRAMVAHQGGQCGFCTPGFVMALSGLFERIHERKRAPQAKEVQNALTGNLCRCTGYQPIIDAAMAVDVNSVVPLAKRYRTAAAERDLRASMRVAVEIQHQDRHFWAPTQASQVAKVLARNRSARIWGSATDLGVSVNKGRLEVAGLVSTRLVPGLAEVKKTGKKVAVGARVTLSQLEQALKREVPELSRFLHVFASPQIKNVATLVGNVANGSPIGDTLPFLQIADAVVEVQGARKRRVPFRKFYRGYRQTDLRRGEWITAITFRLPQADERIRLLKVAQRKDLDISGVNAGIRASMKGSVVVSAQIAFGGVGPTVVSLPKTEAYLKGKNLDPLVVEKALSLLAQEIRPRSDVRGSAEYRVKLSQSLLKRTLLEFAGVIPPC